MPTTKPSVTEIKKLFARSGNCCAFPKCTTPLVLGETLIAEVCHIKGEKPESARFDPDQTPSARQSYDNLILMCPTHHTVIDDDPDAYPPERLLRFKREQEAGAAPASDAEAVRLASLFISQSASGSLVSTVNQSGGIAAGILHASNLSIHTSEPADQAAQLRQTQAVESLWRIARGLQREFGDLIVIDDLLLTEEIDQFIRGKLRRPSMRHLEAYAEEHTFMDKYHRAGADEVESERPFSNHRTWLAIFALRALYGRAALLWQWSFAEGKYRDWRIDPGMDQILRISLPTSIVEDIKKQKHSGLRKAVSHLEALFVTTTGLQKT